MVTGITRARARRDSKSALKSELEFIYFVNFLTIYINPYCEISQKINIFLFTHRFFRCVKMVRRFFRCVAVFFHTSIFSMSVVIHRKNRCAKFFDFCVIFFIFAFVYTSIFSMCEVRLSKKSMGLILFNFCSFVWRHLVVTLGVGGVTVRVSSFCDW